MLLHGAFGIIYCNLKVNICVAICLISNSILLGMLDVQTHEYIDVQKTPEMSGYVTNYALSQTRIHSYANIDAEIQIQRECVCMYVCVRERERDLYQYIHLSASFSSSLYLSLPPSLSWPPSGPRSVRDKRSSGHYLSGPDVFRKKIRKTSEVLKHIKETVIQE